MTQNQLKILSLLSLSLLAFAIFELMTIVCCAVAAYFTYRYASIVIRKHTQRGLIQLLPENIQEHLLHRSIFDMVCDFWFYESFRFLKLLFKPLIEPIYPESAIQALQDVNTETKNKYLVKGVVRIMPQYCQLILLGKERMKKIEELTIQEELLHKKSQKERKSDKLTEDQSENHFPRYKKICSQRDLQSLKNNDEESDYSLDRQIKVQQKARWDKLQHFKKRPIKPNKKNIIEVIQNSIKMIKNIIQIQNVNGHIQKMNTSTIIKLMIIFWLILLVQIKFNKNAKEIVIKILYVLGGIISVFGTVGTTGVLIYKHWKKEKQNNILQLQN